MARRVPAHQREQDQARDDRLAVLRIRLHQIAGGIRTADDWARYLRAAAQLSGETWPNVLLISSRRPAATQVKGYEAWRAVGRHVNRDERGIEIFSASPQRQARHPAQDADEQDDTWRNASRVTYVWDLSQTSGEALPAQPAIPPPPGEIPPGLWDCLCWLARREGFAVEREAGCPADGTTLWTARRIRVLPELPAPRAVWALTHQLGHVLMHNTIAHQPGTTTTGCQGIQKNEADSVAFVVCTRHGIPTEHAFPTPPTWAGTDPRAHPAATILTSGQRITTAATQINRYLDRHLPGRTIDLAVPAEAETAALSTDDERRSRLATPKVTPPAPTPQPGPSIGAVLQDALEFYVGQLPGSWVPAYLSTRGIPATAAGEWRIGYAPRGWTTLTDHLRARGHHDGAIQAAGLARPSSRGTLIDHFRDRVMLPVHDEHGTLAGFTARARPGADPAVPKYLNSPDTSTYKKGDLLFGLHHARRPLAGGATPVLVEGPFDAIAVTQADPDHYAGLAPCGTALTSHQAAALSRAAELRRTGILVAFDDDPAGRKAAVRAYGILRPLTSRLQSVQLPGNDPADILQNEGPTTLRAILHDHVQPLSALVIDAHLAPWDRRLQDTGGPLLAMRSAAALIATLLPPQAAEAIRQITRGRELATTDEFLRPVANPELPQIARTLPADTAYQITRVAERLGFTDYSDVLAEVANAVTRGADRPKALQHHPAPRLASGSFPHPPSTQASSGPAIPPSRRPGKQAEMRRPRA